MVKIAPVISRKKGPQLRGAFLIIVFAFLQGVNARAPLAAITTWIIRKNSNSVDMLPA